MASVLPAAKEAGIPVLTWDTDLLPEAKEFRIAYIGTHNYDIGVELAKLAQKIKPNGGTICIQSGGAAAANHNERMQGIRDTLAGVERGDPPGDAADGANGWTEVDGCPLYTNDDFPLSVQQLEDMLGKYPDLDAFIPTGGFPQFVPDAYRAAVTQYKDKIASGELALVVADTLPVQIDLMKEGLSAGQVGQRPFEMGYKVIYAIKDMKERQAGAGRPDLYGPRRLHARQRRHLHRRLIDRRNSCNGRRGFGPACFISQGSVTREAAEAANAAAILPSSAPSCPLDRADEVLDTLRAGSLPHPPFVRPSGAPRRRAASRRRHCRRCWSRSPPMRRSASASISCRSLAASASATRCFSSSLSCSRKPSMMPVATCSAEEAGRTPALEMLADRRFQRGKIAFELALPRIHAGAAHRDGLARRCGG